MNFYVNQKNQCVYMTFVSFDKFNKKNNHFLDMNFA